MRRLIGFCFAMIMVLGVSGIGHADILTWTSNEYTFNTRQLNLDSSTYFTMTGAPISAINPTFKSATLTLELYEPWNDSDYLYAAFGKSPLEASSKNGVGLKVNSGSYEGQTKSLKNYTNYRKGKKETYYLYKDIFTFSSLGADASTWTSGSLNMVLTNNCPTLYLDDATLTITYTTPSAATPEPSTLLLLGIGLIGIAGLGRKIRT